MNHNLQTLPLDQLQLPLAPPLPFRLVEEMTHECGLCGGDGCTDCGGLGWAVEAAA